MRDRLIDLIVSADISLYGSDKPYAEVYADFLLANGVIVPPCKVGDTVYSCIGRSYKVKKITIKSEQEHMIIVLDSALSGQLIVDETDFGKTVSLTKEEAEKALAERSGK